MKPFNRNTRKTIKAVLTAGICAAVLGTAHAQEAADKPSPASNQSSTIDAVATAPATATAPAVKIRENSYYYSAFNRRDPFRSLIDGTFVRDEKMALVNLNAVTLVGIVRGEIDRFALLEDEDGFSYILRVGDRVRNGSVVSIGDQEMVARVTNFGQTTTIRLHLVERKEGAKR
jgi:biotin carboxyl carrier protein